MNINLIENNTCRICLDDDVYCNLISPCMCSGTSKYVHKECLNKWRILADNHEAYERCFECNYKYKYINNDNQCAPNNVNNRRSIIYFLKYNTISFLLLNIGIIWLLANIIEHIDVHSKLVEIIYGHTDTIPNIDKSTAYIMFSSIIYICCLGITSIINIIRMKNRYLYIKYFRQTKLCIAIMFIVCNILFMIYNFLVGIMIITII